MIQIHVVLYWSFATNLLYLFIKFILQNSQPLHPPQFYTVCDTLYIYKKELCILISDNPTFPSGKSVVQWNPINTTTNRVAREIWSY